MEFTEIVAEITVLFFIMLVGAAGGRSGLIGEEASQSINQIVVNITNPCLIIFAMQRDYSSELLRNSILLVIIGFILFGTSIAISEVWGHLSKEERSRLGTKQFLFVFGNLGFLGFPIMQVILGNVGIFYVAMFGIVQNLLMFSYGYKLFGRAEGWRSSLKQCLNNNFYATVFSLLLFLAQVKLPYLLYQPLNLVGNLTIPLILLSIGSTISRTSFSDLFRSHVAWGITAVKLVAWPLVLIGIFLLVSLPRDVVLVTVILFAMPAALLSGAVAEVNGGDVALANKTVILSNLMVMLTIPAVIWLLTRAGLFV